LARKHSYSIFVTLISSYFLLAFLMMLAFVLGFFLYSLPIFHWYKTVDPASLVTNPTSETAIEAKQLGAWVEELDADYNVVSYSGSKADKVTSYSDAELFELLSLSAAASGSGADYMGYIVRTGNASAPYSLVKIPRNMVRITQTTVLGAYLNATATTYLYFPASICIFGIFVLVMLLTNRIMSPLNNLQTELGKIESGSLDVSLDFSAPTEYRKILESFSHMADALRQEKAAKELAEKQKSQLLLDLSHDIKTPLSTITAYAQAIRDGVVEPGKVKEYLEIVTKKAERVADLSNDMFTILTMGNSDYELNYTGFDVAEQLRSVCALYYSEIESAGLEMDIDIPDEEISIEADERLLRRVFENLVGNAAKYNVSGKQVKVSLRPLANACRIEVSDDGEEIDAKLAGKMFDAFARGDDSRSTSLGTGLGLAIVKAIAEKHGGAAWYERLAGLNCFLVEIPFAREKSADELASR